MDTNEQALVEVAAAPLAAPSAAVAGLDAALEGQDLTDASLSVYIAGLHAAGLSPAVASMAVASVKFRCRLQGLASPVGPATDRVLAGLRREGKGRGRGQVDGVRFSQVDTAAAVAANDSGSVAGLRDAALLAVASDGLLRVSATRTGRCFAAFEGAATSKAIQGAGCRSTPSAKSSAAGRPLDKLPKRVQVEARHLLTQLPYAPTRQEATKRRDQFAKRFRRECPDAVDILERDGDRMVTFYDFPEAHWQHLRTTNVVESPFASVRLRTDAAKRYKKVANATALIWRVLMVAEKRFRRLNAPHLMADVYAGECYENGSPIAQRKKIAA